MKTFKQMYYEGEQQRQTNDAQRREKQALMRRHQQQDDQAKAIDMRTKEREKEKKEREKEQQQRQSQTENAPSLAVLKKKIKSGTKLGSSETASAKARGLIPRADGTKRKSDKYK